MSLEAKIELLTEAVTRLIDAINSQSSIVVPSVPVVQVEKVKEPVPLVAPTPVAPVAAPVVPAPAEPAVVSPSSPVMPAPPVFAAPVAAPAPAGAPFTDGKGLIDYVMSAYRAMGAEKGAGIQGVLVNLGYQNINDVKPEHYGALYQGIEQLKN